MEISDQKLDQLITSFVLADWQKVAMILAKSLEWLQDEGAQVGPERLAARIESLVLAGRLESQGNLSRWRHSEIRLATEDR
jgi:uncharacterized protein DUF3658